MYDTRRTEIELHAWLIVGGRRIPAMVWSLSLTDVELDADDVQPVTRRVGLEIALDDEDAPVGLSGEITRHGALGLSLRLVAFAPGARARLERFLDERDTLTLHFVEEAPLLLERKALPRPLEREPTMHLPCIPVGAKRVAIPVSIARADAAREPSGE